MRRRSRAAAGPPAFAIAGWLFAELAAILMIVAFASADSPQEVPRQEGPGAGREDQGVLLTPVTFVLPVPAGDDGGGTVARFRTDLARVVGPDRSVGLALMFGVSRDPDRPLAGTAVSRRLVELVRDLPELERAADIRPYLGDSEDGAPGEVRVELFLLTGS
ncbi:hypothetical protein WHI96_11485 [Pseudonocardia tropica]|uniref:SOUL heme-binding protein n=1 Tax=Pseudonocardia tropica TaxID=681289 RepID=A0ABV1JW97_9PSEU